MFNYKEDFLDEEIGSGTQKIMKSGCYNATIEKTGVLRSKESKSETLILNFKTDENENAKILLCYKDKSGNDVDFNNKHLSHLIYLLGINPALVKEVKNEEGKLHYPILENKEIGIFLSFKGMRTYTGTDGNEYEDTEYNFRGFFHVITGKTAKETKSNSEPIMYDTWQTNFETENRIRENKKNEKIEHEKQNDDFSENIKNSGIDDDDFPF